MKISIINKILLIIEIIPTLFLLLFSIVLVGDSRILFNIASILSILSMISLLYIVIKMIFNNSYKIEKQFVYLCHIGVLLTIMGYLVLFINGNEFKELSPHAPYSIFFLGTLFCIPYLHVMILNRFFISKEPISNG